MTHPADYHAVISGQARGAKAAGLRGLAGMIAPLYRGVVGLRNWAYRSGFKKTHRAQVPVISVGNLTTGGTGKTPMVGAIVQMLLDAGHRPAVLMRGYRAKDGAEGDEQALLIAQCPGVAVIANPDRVAGARSAMEHGPSILVLDDGFQHRRIGRDLDLVLIDATCPFGFGRVLPRGLLREPASNLRRADAVIVTRADHLDDAGLDTLRRRITQLHGNPPIALSAHIWRDILDGDDRPIDAQEATVVGLCGIGNPAPFESQVRGRMNVADWISLPDHHNYTRDDLDHAFALAGSHHADALLVTEKDWVKIQPLIQSDAGPVPVWRPRLALEFLEGGDALRQRVTDAAGAAAQPPTENAP